MIYKIYYEGDRKFALPIKNREQLMKLRNAKTNLKNLEKVRQGDEKAKHDLLQLAYNLGRVEGAIAGCKSIGSFFFHDVDYYDDAQTEQIKQHILDRREDIGLVMLERSPRGGWHLVCKRRQSGASVDAVAVGDGYLCQRLATGGVLHQWQRRGPAVSGRLYLR